MRVRVQAADKKAGFDTLDKNHDGKLSRSEYVPEIEHGLSDRPAS